MTRKKVRVVKNDQIRIVPFAAIFFFLLLGAIGISLGEPSRVLEQATQICLSCIGIG